MSFVNLIYDIQLCQSVLCDFNSDLLLILFMFSQRFRLIIFIQVIQAQTS